MYEPDHDFATSGVTYDVIFDAVGKSSFSDCMKSLKKEGIYLQSVAAPALNARMRWISMTSSKTLIGGTATPDTDELNFLKDLVEEGKIRPVIDSTFPLNEASKALGDADEGHGRGKKVIIVA